MISILKMAFNNSMCSYLNKSRQSGSNTHIASMKDGKEYLKPDSNALIKWWIPVNILQLQCRWIKEFTTQLWK
jgi:hypothetical protein